MEDIDDFMFIILDVVVVNQILPLALRSKEDLIHPSELICNSSLFEIS